MTPGTRACVACLAGRVALNVAAIGVRDLDRGIDHRIGGTILGDRVGLYDYERSSNFSGTLPNLRDAGVGAELLLNVDGLEFGGCDVGSGREFSGWVNDWNIHLVDDAESRVFVYTLLRLDPAPSAESGR